MEETAAAPRVTVKLPASLRPHAEGRQEARVEASSVGEALRRLAERHAALGTHLFDDAGRVRGHVNVFVGGRRVDDPASEALGEGDEVRLVPSIAGG
ncbi:MAG TPA: MoaD/ThiS family protein [Gemmatimonadota bacterium]|nr:MoaD/ThiS family protein [Gemmatimonadota bacterium]